MKNQAPCLSRGTCDDRHVLGGSREGRARFWGGLRPDAELLWEVEVDTREEAEAIYHLRMGFEPFILLGERQSCPRCGAVFYPEGSGECWRCGKIC